MFNFLKRRLNFTNFDNGSDNLSETANINASDSAPILNNTNYDLNANSNTTYGNSIHDLRRSDVEVSNVKRSLRTIPGVFFPVCLSMCSVAVFMRVGFIVGMTGVYQSIAVYILAISIFVLTGLSVCAISTNGAIQGGGVYYMISRALGPEFGGSIGTLFFFANAFGSAFNGAGLVEALLSNFGASNTKNGLPEGHYFKILYGTILNIFSLIICLLGANLFSYAVSFIYLILVVVYFTNVLSIFVQKPMNISLPGLENQTAMFTGLSSETFRSNLYSNYVTDYTNNRQTSFAYVFGVLFSSLTGIMAGANMSGELKKPARSIPLGTLSAVVFVFIVYFSENLLLAASCERNLLVYNNQVLQDINLWGPFVPIGIIATTFSGELSCLIGSSRLLKALADDELFGSALNFVKNGKTKSGNPYVAVIIAFIIAEMVLFIGSINAISPLVTIFYLLAYFGVNLACLALDLASAPNFRPTFKYFSWHTALIGMVGSITMTFIVSVEYASIAIGLLIAMITVLYFRDFPPEWGSISQALIFHQVRKYLLLLDIRKDHVKFWRPQILLLVSNPRSCIPLIDFGNDIKKGGLFVIGNVKLGELENFDEDPCAKELPAWMDLVDNMKVKAFVELTLSSTIKNGIHNLIRLSGLGGMKPNTVMIGFYDNTLPEDLLKNRLFPKRKRRANYGLVSQNSNINFASNLSSCQFEELRAANDANENRLKQNAFVDIIRDVLKLKKNLCVCRRFNTLKKETLKIKTTPLYIDVWPINFLLPELNNQLDSTCLFMLQLSCILNMVSVWRRGIVRVFLCSESHDALENMRRKTRLEELLVQLRIHAQVHLVPFENVKNLINRPIISESDLPHYQQGSTNLEILNVSEIYLKAANQLVRQYSESASICFLYLPSPPPVKANETITINSTNNETIFSTSNNLMQQDQEPNLLNTSALIPEISDDLNSQNSQRYMKVLETLSDALPPCILVNGISCVTSTNL